MINKLQVQQNKLLRIITKSNRYTPIELIHLRARMPKMKDFIIARAENFYRSQVLTNPLTEQIGQINQLNTEDKRHGFIHQDLSLFQQ